MIVSSHCELTGPVSFWSFLCNYEASETIIKNVNGETTKGRGNAERSRLPHMECSPLPRWIENNKMEKNIGYISFANCVIVI